MILSSLRPYLAAALTAFAIGLVLGAAVPQGAAAQSQAEVTAPDYEAWESLATLAETLIANRETPSPALTSLRGELVEERNRFMSVQEANRERVAALRRQIEALGPPPEEGQFEAEEIADRRAALAEQLGRAQAPVLAAEEAWRRADGMIRQIDRILRERDADALMRLSPSPVNPANWIPAVDALFRITGEAIEEGRTNLADPARQAELRANLIIVIGALALAAFLMLRGFRYTEQITNRLQDGTTTQSGRQAITLLASLSQIAVPALGVFLFAFAVNATSLPGPTVSDALHGLLLAGITYLGARWLGAQVFTRSENAYTPLRLPSERRREGRFMAQLAGLLLGLQVLYNTLIEPRLITEAAQAVLAFPIKVLAGVVLFRIGQLLVTHARGAAERAAETDDPATPSETPFFDKLVGVVGRIGMVLGLGAPVLAAVGYVSASQALLFPAIASLGLLGLLVLLQGFVADLYAAIVRDRAAASEALVPALIGFGLAVVSVPVFALIWGVRVSELLEIWQSVREGFQLGDTRISPTNLLSFVLIFAIGYIITRMVQGALGSTVLPKTRMDRGGQKAIVSGTGYVGIFLAAVIAFSTAGIDLSALALVAGALSVGIGFGLQNVVSNFISGIILLVERPIAEGDWIEVGGTMGIVRAISVRSTVIETFDKTNVIVPNSDLIATSVTNWTQYNNTGRLIVKVGVSYTSDTLLVERILREVAEAQPIVALNPPPSVVFMEFGADALEFEVRCILRDVNFLLKVRSDMHHEIARRFREAGIEIPFAQRDIWLRNPETLRAGAPQPSAPTLADDRESRAPRPGDPLSETARPDAGDLDQAPEDGR